jgi:hypothetical protein
MKASGIRDLALLNHVGLDADRIDFDDTQAKNCRARRDKGAQRGCRSVEPPLHRRLTFYTSYHFLCPIGFRVPFTRQTQPVNATLLHLDLVRHFALHLFSLLQV